MSGQSVCVLAPNGRRQTVKCSPNTTILQIIEEVCQKQGFNPEEYDIKHHNKKLDTTTTFRFSGLPNNAQLELTTAVKNRVESDIILAVNLENGARLTDTFNPNDTLLNVLNKLCPEMISEDKNPVVIYTRREIYGRELENCTLRSLGLTGGRAMIRVINRDPELLKQQANVSAPIPTKPVEEKPYQRKFQPLEEPKIEQSDKPKQLPKPEEQKDADLECQATSAIKPHKFVKDTKVDLIKLAKEKRKSTEKSVVEEKKKSLENKKQNVEKMDVDSIDSDDNTCSRDGLTPKKNLDQDFVFLGARNAMLFSLETSKSIPTEDLPDDFFELTITDAKKILRDVRKARYEMDNTPLKTAELRKLDESQKQLKLLNRYRKAIIRVQFPDRVVLQGTFLPVETVGDVKEFVREYLDKSDRNFYLYSTPPKCILSEECRLVELGFVPGAIVHFGTAEDVKENIVKPELRAKITSNSVASLAAAKIRQEGRRNIRDEDDEIDYMDIQNDTAATPTAITDDGASTSSGITHTSERKIFKSTEKVPKWFKQ